MYKKIQNKELEIVTKLGEKRIVLLSAHYVKNNEGQLLHSVSVQRDITEYKRLLEGQKRTNYLLRELF